MTHYTPTAEQHIAALQNKQRLQAQVILTCQTIITSPDQARQQSRRAIRAADGTIHFAMPVKGHPPTTIFWQSSGPTIKAVINWQPTSRSRP